MQHTIQQISLSENLFNRTQWYTFKIKFPLELANTNCGISQGVSFLDSRKRRPDENIDGIYIDLAGICSTSGEPLLKCTKCQMNDKKIYCRKRGEEHWSEKDELNNNRLFHLTHDGTETIDSEGYIKLKLRIMCCVGSFRQFHLNHVDQQDSKSYKHKDCTGLMIKFIIYSNGKVLDSLVHQMNLRVIGKVTPNTREIINTPIKIDQLSHEETLRNMIKVPAMNIRKPKKARISNTPANNQKSLSPVNSSSSQSLSSVKQSIITVKQERIEFVTDHADIWNHLNKKTNIFKHDPR
jgi:hypothetical protein